MYGYVYIAKFREVGKEVGTEISCQIEMDFSINNAFISLY